MLEKTGERFSTERINSLLSRSDNACDNSVYSVADLAELSLFAFAANHQPKDFQVNSIFLILRENLREFSDQEKSVVLQPFVGRFEKALATAVNNFSLKPPAELGDALELAIGSANTELLEECYSLTIVPGRFPASYYARFIYGLVVAENAVSLTTPEFLQSLKILAQLSFKILQEDLSPFGQETNNRGHSSVSNRLLYLLEKFSQTELTKPLIARLRWRKECAESLGARRQAHERFIRLCDKLGVELKVDNGRDLE